MKRLLVELARFCAVGAMCLAVTVGGLATLHDLIGMYYLTAFAVSVCGGNLLGYILNGRFTFSAHTTASGMARYFLLNTVLLAASSLLMKALVDCAHIWYITASLLIAIANTPISFLLHRCFSYQLRFGREASAQRAEPIGS